MTSPTAADMLKASQALARDLSGEPAEEALGARFVALLGELLPGRTLSLRLVDGHLHELTGQFVAGPHGTGANGGVPQLLGDARQGPLWIRRTALRHTGLPVDIATSARVRLTDRYMPLFSSTVHGFSVPLVAGGELLGVVNCEYPEEPMGKAGLYELARKDEAAILPLCSQVSVSLSNLRLLHRVRSLEQQVVQAERLATLGQFAAGVVHELNNPLTSIGVYGDYLAQRLRDAGEPFRDDAEKARRICEGAERIQKLTRDLMSYGRPTSDTEVLQLAEVVTQALSFCDHLLRRAGVRVQVQNGDGLVLQGVRTQLQQVVVNLVTNACHACTESAGGEARISIETAATKIKGRDAVHLRVVDTGGGIPEPHRAHIFEPFFSTKAAGRGTGLGLPIVKHIVEAHGGQVSFETHVGAGTCFLVVLPTTQSREQRQPYRRQRVKKRAAQQG